MSRLRQILRRLRAPFVRKRLEDEMAEEMRAHVEHLADESLKEGLSPQDAYRAAQRRFGGMDQFKETCRDGMTWGATEGLCRDIRFAVRMLRKNLGFTTAALATLALCIGANTVIFSIVYALLIKPMPFPQPGGIVEVSNVFNAKTMDSNLVQYLDYKAHANSYESVGLWRLRSLTVGNAGAEERVTAASCTPEMFGILGLKPVIGRFFTAENCKPGEEHVVVLTESFWEARFHRDPGVLDQPFYVGGEPSRIIGVAPRATEAFDARVRFIKPEPWKPAWIDPTQRYALDSELFARLKPGVTAGQAQAEAAAIEHHFYDSAPGWNKKILEQAGYRVSIEPVEAKRARKIKAPLYLLQGGVILVLLIGCVNIANLLLVRASGRQREMAIRLSVGATRAAIARQLLVECTVLTLLGSAFGVGGAFGAIHSINHYAGKMLPAVPPFAIEGRVLCLTVALAVTVAILIGILPIRHVLKPQRGAFAGSSKTVTRSRRLVSLSGSLVMAQVAITVVLLAGGGLLVHSFAKAIAVKPGFDPEQLLTARIALGRPYWNEHGAVFQKQLVTALKEIPGVTDAAIAEGVPFEGGIGSYVLTLKEGALAADAAQPAAYQIGVSAGYFEALHIRLIEGRFYNDRDADGVQYVVDERFAKMYFPGRSAIGGHFTFQNRHLPTKPEDWPVIVGVVQNVPYNGVEDRGNIPFTYYPLLNAQPEEPNLFVRSSRPTEELIASIRETIHGLDPDIPLYHVERLRTAIDESLDNRRAIMLLIGGFAALALFLSAVGTYGVLAFDVSERTREIGIRCALGSSRRQIVNMILRQGMLRTAVGMTVGLAGALLLCRLMEALLFDLGPNDPATYWAVSVLIAAVATVASYIPARRAASIEPTEALRME